MARGEGLRVRLARIPGETPKHVLRRPLVLPAVMNGFSWTEEALHSEYDTVGDGKFSQPALGPASARQLRAVDDVEAMVLEWDAPWLVEQGLDPDDVYDELFAVLRSRKAIELLATPQLGRARPLLRMNITIRSISPAMRQGEPDGLYYTLRFSEWRHASSERRGAGRGDHLPTTHRLTDKDSLHSLSEAYYHTTKWWQAIAQANGVTRWGPKTPLVQMRRFKVGSKVKIPKIVVAHAGPVKTHALHAATIGPAAVVKGLAP